MKQKMIKTVILCLFIAAAGIIVIGKNKDRDTQISKAEHTSESQVPAPLPRLVDLGSHSCVPCKMMMPILDTLREVHAEKLEVVFIDVWEDREAGDQYGVRAIPTQIIYDEQGNELFRHEGFWSRKDIETKLKELQVLTGENS